MAKTDFTGTGQSSEVFGASTVQYYADFTTGSGAGTVQLQVQMDGDWLPADEAFSADMDYVKVCETTRRLVYRWNCTAYSSGTISCYLKSDVHDKN